MKIIHCDKDRGQEQRVFMETADGKFKYEVIMDYAKGLPEGYELVPTAGNISGGCVDKDDNLYCGLRGGSFMNPNPRTCLIKLDPDGNFVETLGEDLIQSLHFFECTDHDTMVVVQTNQSYAFEMTMDGKQIVRTFGEKNKPCDNNRDMDNAWWDTRQQYGLFPTEPFGGYEMGAHSMVWKIAFERSEVGGPFHCPTDVDVDSKGNYFFSDGYMNAAVQKFDKDGNFVKTFGGKGIWDAFTDTPGKFLVPHSICVDANDNVWVCDREKDAVHIFDNDGNVIAYASHNMGQASGIDTDGEYVYVVGRGGYLTIFDLEFNVVGQLGAFNGNLRGHHIAADSKGNLYIFPTHANWEHQIIALKRIR